MAQGDFKKMNAQELTAYGEALDGHIEKLRKKKINCVNLANSTQRHINELRQHATDVRRELRSRAAAERHNQSLKSSANKRRRLAAQIDRKDSYVPLHSSSSLVSSADDTDDDDLDELVSEHTDSSVPSSSSTTPLSSSEEFSYDSADENGESAQYDDDDN